MRTSLTIEYQAVKRDLGLPIRVFCDKDTAQRLRDALDKYLADEGISIGWFDVYAPIVPTSLPNTAPLPWK